jgi:hypothetical protein
MPTLLVKNTKSPTQMRSRNGAVLSLVDVTKSASPMLSKRFQNDLLERIKRHHPKTGILEKISFNEVKVQTMNLSPDECFDLLTRNTGNRPIKWNDISRWLGSMNADKWYFNGDVIRFNKKGKIIDGQNKLIASYLSKKTHTFNIQTGLSNEASATIDIGRIRTSGDVLAMEGYSNYNTLAAAVKAYIYFKNEGKIGTNIFTRRVNNMMIVEWLENENDKKLMMKCVDYVVKDILPLKRSHFLSGSTWAFVYYLLSKLHRSDATEFITRLANGSNISDTGKWKPVYLVREKLASGEFGASHLRVLTSGGSKITDLKVRYVIRAWNAWRTGEGLKKDFKLKIDSKSQQAEIPQ